MRRFIAVFALGAALIGVAMVGIGLGSHPERLASLQTFLIHSLTLVIGSAIIGSGLVGMAEEYEKASRRLAELMTARVVEVESEGPLKDRTDLNSCDRSFWAAYRNSALAVALFMAAILALTVGTVGYSHLIYLSCISAGVAIFGVTALLIAVRGMRAIRSGQQQVDRAAEYLQDLPEPVVEEPPPRPKRRKWTVRRDIPRYAFDGYRRRER